MLPDDSYSLIYIDGDHAYEGVMRDTQVAIRKLRRDGLLIFNDYIVFDHLSGQRYGVVLVVNDLCVNHGWRITFFSLHHQMFCDVGLCRA